MQIRFMFMVGRLCPLAAWLGLAGLLTAQNPPEFTDIRVLTNHELLLQFSAPAGYYRIDASPDLSQWNGLLTLLSAGSQQHTDSAAPFLASRYYRAQPLVGTNLVTGDHLVTSNGAVVFHPVNHASLVMSWQEKTIYVDPVGSVALYAGLPRADLVLLTHEHSDHFSSSTLGGVTNTNAMIFAPQAVFDAMSSSLSLRNLTTVLTNGARTNVLGLMVDAIPAYNTTTSWHPAGRGNGYVVTVSGRPIYISGDTEDTPEMRALRNMEVAFLSMNLPYTMSVSQAVSAVRAFHPNVVYPYHYRTNPPSPPTDLSTFKQQVSTNPGVEVRIRKWY